MMGYSVQHSDQKFVKGYRFLSFTKNVGKNIGKNISKNLSSAYSQKLLHYAKQSAIVAPKTASKRTIQKQQAQMVIIQRQLQMKIIKR